MNTANSERYSQRLILEMGDLWQYFVNEVQGLPIHFNDRREIITQILDIFIDFGMNGPARLERLPDTNRIVDTVYQDPASNEYQRLHVAVQHLARGIHARLEQIGGIRLGAAGSGLGFPYYVQQFLGDDVVLDHLPF